MSEREPIKTYHHVHAASHQSAFSLARMDRQYERLGGTPSPPHRHDFYTLMWIHRGQGRHIIDFQDFELGERQVYFVSPGQVHQLIEEAPTDGWALTFSEEFLDRNHIDPDFIADLNLFRSYGVSPPLEVPTAQVSSMDGWIKGMEHWCETDSPLADQAIGAYLKLMLIQCHQICPSPPLAEHPQHHAGISILKQFRELVERHIRQQHQVAFYAEQLAITPDHLNKTIKSLIGKSAKSYLQDRIIIDAKRQLRFSDDTTKQIGYSLGFSDPAYFSHFFKKCVGVSPVQFRKEIV
ncbi:helix-turn-helix domain-containing protein [Pontibacter sp. G13]|uniref:helix-turn-helix domain-containing protein n=1 Tax=Pontibacter sp. G13 TaxID=3074898 RepID=UPI002889092F|nr:helix-turn-helix domain-containing protein [Pontibacter sp. G13]WNJ17068.1 helix-turn-helix domain-containing protein [Pontibacter sp. G13]